jgi:hypothetical protein
MGRATGSETGTAIDDRDLPPLRGHHAAMKAKVLRVVVAVGLAMALAIGGGFFAAATAGAHGGGLDRCGCHHERRTVRCHCHRDRGGCECRPDRCG